MASESISLEAIYKYVKAREVKRFSHAKQQRTEYEHLNTVLKGLDSQSMSRKFDANIGFENACARYLPIKEVIIPVFNDRRLRYQFTNAYVSVVLSTNPETIAHRAGVHHFSYIGAMITAFVNFFDTPQFRDDINTGAYLAGYSIHYLEVAGIPELFRADKQFLAAVTEFNTIPDEEAKDERYAMAQLGVFMLLMVKNITADNCKAFLSQKLTALYESLKLAEAGRVLSWSHQSCAGVYCAISASFELRKTLFQKLYTVAHDNQVPNHGFFKAVLGFFRFAECYHLVLIMDYLIKNPALIAMVPVWFQNNEYTLSKAFEFLMERGEEGPYVRLLVPKSQCQPILARNLAPYRDIALCIARIQSPNFKYYIPQTDENRMSALQSRVEAYLKTIAEYSVTNALKGNNTAKTLAIQSRIDDSNVLSLDVAGHITTKDRVSGRK